MRKPWVMQQCGKPLEELFHRWFRIWWWFYRLSHVRSDWYIKTHKQPLNSITWQLIDRRMMYLPYSISSLHYNFDLYGDNLTKTLVALSWATINFFYLFFDTACTRNVLWSKIDLIVPHVSYFKFATRAIKPTSLQLPVFSGIGVLRMDMQKWQRN